MQRDPGVFSLAHRYVQFSDESLVAALRAFSARTPGAFTSRQFDAWPERPCVAQTIVKRFGSWRKALLQVGLHARRAHDYDPAALVEELAAIWRRAGRAPGIKLMNEQSRFTTNTYIRHWGSLREACRRFAQFHAGSISWEDLLKGTPRRPVRAGVPSSQRWRILERDGRVCRVCGRAPDPARALTLHVDHIVPVSKGGDNADHNLRVLCSECNLGRSDRAA